MHKIYDQPIQVRKNFLSKKVEKTLTLFEILQNIENDNTTLIKEARIIYKSDTKKYAELKKQSACCHFPAFFKEGNFTEQNIINYTGLVYFDIDGEKNPEINFDELKKQITEIPHYVACWKSFSNNGLGILFLTGSIPGKSQYENAFFSLEALTQKEILQTRNCNVQQPTRCTVLSFDPNICINPNPVPFAPAPITPPAPVFAPTAPRLKDHQHRYYNQSFTDVHLTDYITEQKQLGNIIEYDCGYTLCTEQIPVTRSFGRSTKIPVHYRNITLFKEYCVFVALNGILLSPSQLYNHLFNYNNTYCEIPLEEDELTQIHQNVMVKYQAGALSVPHTMRNGAWSISAKLSANEKKSISASARKDRNKLLFCKALVTINNDQLNINSLSELCTKSKKTINKYIVELYDDSDFHPTTHGKIFTLFNQLHYTISDAITDLKEQKIKITKQIIADKMKVSVSTVKRQWKHYKDQIESYNKNLKTK
jgi:hypothetical protein